jgi:glycosyltransferase involved in cell wall biosynthesis
VNTLLAIPVYNEERYVSRVLDNVLQRVRDVLVIDDGSTDATATILTRFPVDVIRHSVNRGYGRSMQDSFSWAALRGYDWVITMDCDEQHEPASIPVFLDRIKHGRADVISGSRYMDLTLNGGGVVAGGGGVPPPERRAVNLKITDEINRRLSARLGVLTDSFCGFKAYRVSRVADLPLTQDGYAFPMQFWVQAAAMGLRIEELPVKLIYNDPNRSFGGQLDDHQKRLAHYRDVLHNEILRWIDRLPPAAKVGLETPASACRGCGCG